MPALGSGGGCATCRRGCAPGDAAHGSLLIGQDAGLIDTIEPAGALVGRLAAEAEDVLRRRGAEVLI